MNGYQLGGKKLKVQLKRDNSKHSKPFWQSEFIVCSHDQENRYICVTIDHYIVSSGLPPMCRWWWLLYLCSIHILENRRIVYFRRSIVVAFVPSDLVHQTLIHSIVFLILMNHFVVNNVLGISGMTCFSVCIILDLI